MNCFTETASSPLTANEDIETILKVDPLVEAELKRDIVRWRAERDQGAVDAAIVELVRVANSSDPVDNIMNASIALAKAGGTTGEWSSALRKVFGVYRAPTGVSGGIGRRGDSMASVAKRSKALADATGSAPKLLVAKPGLDGHSSGAEQIAVAARDAGFEVIYQGIRLTPEEIVAAARDEDVDIIGISILSGSHLALVPEIIDRLRDLGVDADVVVGGIIPPEDAIVLKERGVTAVYTPKDFELHQIMEDMVSLVEAHRAR